MAVQAQGTERLLNVAEQDGQLVVTRLGAPFRPRYIWGVAAVAALVLVLIGWLWAAHLVRPGYLLFAFIAFIALLAVADRAYNIRQFSGRDDVFVLDKKGDRILRNGSEYAKLSDAQQVLVRHVRTEDLDDEGSDHILLLIFEDRKLRIAESLGIAGVREEILAAAREIGAYAGLVVEEGYRMQSEYWMDV